MQPTQHDDDEMALVNDLHCFAQKMYQDMRLRARIDSLRTACGPTTNQVDGLAVERDSGGPGRVPSGAHQAPPSAPAQNGGADEVLIHLLGELLLQPNFPEMTGRQVQNGRAYLRRLLDLLPSYGDCPEDDPTQNNKTKINVEDERRAKTALIRDYAA